METLELLKKNLREDRPAAWEQIPDIELYMDQVIGYMPRQHIGLPAGEALTPAMINNYVKQGLLPRANGKRYSRQHLAYLTAICLFKQVLSVSDTDALLKLLLEDRTIGSFYELYRGKLDHALADASQALDDDLSREEIKDLLLEMAVSSYTQKFVCESLLHMLGEPDRADKKDAKKGKEPKPALEG